VRISFVTDTYLPEVNGVTTVVAAMRQGLRSRGHTVQVLAPEYPLPGPDDDGVIRRPSIPCPGYSAVRLSSPFGADVTRALDRFAPDLIHVVTEGPLGAVGRRYALRQGRPLVTSFHTDFPRYAARYLGEWAVGPAQRYLRAFHEPAALTQTPSEATRGELAALGVTRVVVWGRGVDSHHFTPARRDAMRRAALGVGRKTVVLHVGRLAVEKDPNTLITAFTAARDRLGDEAVYWVAGDGPRGDLVRRALPFARHLGFLERDVLADLYADADLFVFPSPTETCGLVALEAMASGLPVVSADLGGVLENVRHGINGVIVPAGDGDAFARAVVQLVRQRPQREVMAQAARAFAVARDWGNELDALGPMYSRAVDLHS
jgi:glycosyltransferase involved in cell wall biosynthesis